MYKGKPDSYYLELDKRTKEYKDYKEWADNQASPEGLGDVVEKITTKTGIKKAVKWLAGEDCGCDERKKALNKALNFRRFECLTEEEYNTLDNYFKTVRGNLTAQQQKPIIEIYNRVFKSKRSTTSCSPCWKSVHNDLRKIYLSYDS